MKKIICILCSIAILLSISTVCFAAEAPAREIAPVSEVTPVATNGDGIMPCESVISFNLLQPGAKKVGAEGRVSQGETELHITSCTWYPANTIWIGFCSLDTGKEYIVEFENGSVSDFTITTEDVPSGTYHVFVRNKGNSGIGSGTLYYEWLG